jgi:serine protease Do
MMRQMIFVALVTMLSGCVSYQPISPVSDVTPQTVNRDAVNQIAIERVVTQVPRGQQIGVIQGGMLCIPHATLTSGAGQAAITDAGYLDAITHEFSAIDYPITTSPTELFVTGTANSTRIRLAARILDVKQNICFPMSGFGNLSDGTADASVRIEWQAFDAATKAIILKSTTLGYGTVKSMTSAPGALANDLAAGMAARRFITSPEFQSLSTAQLTPIAPLRQALTSPIGDRR